MWKRQKILSKAGKRILGLTNKSHPINIQTNTVFHSNWNILGKLVCKWNALVWKHDPSTLRCLTGHLSQINSWWSQPSQTHTTLNTRINTDIPHKHVCSHWSLQEMEPGLVSLALLKHNDSFRSWHADFPRSKRPEQTDQALVIWQASFDRRWRRNREENGKVIK